MKRLKLKALELGAVEMLSRAQLKHVVGGSGSGGGLPCFDNSSCPSGQTCIANYCSGPISSCGACPPPLSCRVHLGEYVCS